MFSFLGMLNLIQFNQFIFSQEVTIIKALVYSTIECLDKATALNPNNVLAYTKKFYVLPMLKKCKDTIKSLDKAIVLDPKNLEALHNRKVLNMN